MRTKSVARVAAPAALAAVLAAGWPAVDHAHAESKLAPDAASSTIVSGGNSLSLSSAPAQPIKTVTQVAMAFTGGDIKASWQDYTDLSTLPKGRTHLSYVCVVPAGTTTCTTDANSTTLPASNVMQVSIPATLPDGSYQLYAVAYPTSCPDQATVASNVTTCNADTFAGTIPDGQGNPFQFTVDDTAPAAPVVTAPSATTIDGNAVKAVTISGTAEPGSDVVVTVHSSGGGSTFFANPGGTTADPSTGAWSISPSLASVPDGTLTISATARDIAGNISAPGSPSSAPALAARPSAPRNLAIFPGAAGLGVTWAAPLSAGGLSVTGYRVDYTDTTAGTAAQSVTAASSATSAVVSGLTNGHVYSVSVAATNAVGTGAPATATATPKPATALYVTPSYSQRIYGQVETLYGRLTKAGTDTGIANAPITLTSKYDNGAAGPTYHATADEFGYWQVTNARPARNVRYTAVFAGDSANAATSSPATRVLVRAAVRISKVSASSRSHTVAVRLSGAVGPNERGRRVYLYEIVGHRTVKLGVVSLTSTSTWAFSHKWTRGTHYVVARFLTQNGIQGNTSNRVKIVRS